MGEIRHWTKYKYTPQVSTAGFLLTPIYPAYVCNFNHLTIWLAWCIRMWTSAIPRSSCRPSGQCIRWSLCCHYPWEGSIPERRWSPRHPPASHWQGGQAALRGHITVFIKDWNHNFRVPLCINCVCSQPSQIKSGPHICMVKPVHIEQQLTAGSNTLRSNSISVRGVIYVV